MSSGRGWVAVRKGRRPDDAFCFLILGTDMGVDGRMDIFSIFAEDGYIGGFYFRWILMI